LSVAQEAHALALETAHDSIEIRSVKVEYRATDGLRCIESKPDHEAQPSELKKQHAVSLEK